MEESFDIASSIKKLRLQTEKTQHDVALGIGVADSVYQRYERGARVPVLSVIRSLCLFYGVSADYFLGLIDTPRPLADAEEEEKEEKKEEPTQE